jgi:hypothetical protein
MQLGARALQVPCSAWRGQHRRGLLVRQIRHQLANSCSALDDPMVGDTHGLISDSALGAQHRGAQTRTCMHATLRVAAAVQWALARACAKVAVLHKWWVLQIGFNFPASGSVGEHHNRMA